MKKRMVSIMLALLMLLSLMPTMAFAEDGSNVKSGSCGSNATWVLDEQGHLSITGTGEMDDFERISDWYTGEVIKDNRSPWEDYMDDITSVTIGEGITSVGVNAFIDAANLESVDLPKTLKTIKYNAFCDCSSLKEVIIPNACESIGVNAFYKCSSMERFVIGSGLKKIGEAVFIWSDSLKSFEVSADNTAYKSVSGVLLTKDGKTLLSYPGGRACDSYTIPSTVTTISEDGFAGVENGPKEIIIPSSVTTIGSSAFWYLNSLEKITFPKSVTDLGDFYTLFGCSNLREVNVQANVDIIPYGFAAECTSLESVVLPESVTTIDGGAFNNCQKLSKINVPKNLESIGGIAFTKCKSLVEFPFPKSLIYIGDRAFLDSGITEMPTWLDKMEDGSYAKLIKMEFTATHNQTKARNMLSLINDMRTGGNAWIRNQNGEKQMLGTLGALTYDYDLEKIAMQRANEIAVYFDHTRPNGGNCFDIVYNGTSSYGENICAGSGTTAGAFDLWCETDQPYSGQGHRRNMLDADWDAIGIASVTVNGITYWVQEFSMKNSGAAKTTANNTSETVSVDFTKSAVDNAKIVLGKNSMTVNKGSSATLPTATVEVILTEGWGSAYEKCNEKATWKSSDSSVAKIENGKVYALKCGSATLTASAFGATAKVSVTVPHAWDAGKITKKATETNAGTKTFTCKECGTTKTETIPKLTPTAPNAPTLSISKADGKITISWGAVTGATKYWIYRGTDGTNFKYYDTTTKTSYTNSSVTSGTKYYYKVKAVKTVDGKDYVSSYSNAKSTIPLTTPTLSISRDDGKIKLSWGAVTGATKYWIYRSTDGVNFKYYDSTTKTSYTNSAVTSGTTYYYKVRAVKAVNDTDWTSSYSAAKSTVPLTTPTLSISKTAGKIKLSWSTVTGATKYWIYRSTDGVNFKYYDTTTNTSYTNSSVTSGTKYYYKVKAVKTVDGTDWASSYSAAKSTIPLTTPTLSAKLSSGKAYLSWSAVTGATKYWIYRSTDGVNFKYYDTTTNTSYTNSSITAGTTYYYKVKAVKTVNGTDWTSDYSNKVSVSR